ncbi:MAG: L,D-transpeptidase family protein [Candidatus Nanopelagicales bacterium]
MPLRALAAAGLAAVLAVGVPAAATAVTDAAPRPAAQQPTAPRALPPYHPANLTGLDGAGQVVVVTARGWRSTRGWLRTYERRTDGAWRQVDRAVPAWLGRHGMAPAATRRQSTGTTPAGTFALVGAFGSRPDPGTAMPYRRFDRDDRWPYDPRDPATYNVLQTRDAPGRWRPWYVEHLWRLRDQYRYVAVIDYNLPPGPVVVRDGLRVTLRPADTRAGGGIFLHVDDDRPTAGCVGIDVDRMRRVLRWLDPAAHPHIVIGPTSALPRA